MTNILILGNGAREAALEDNFNKFNYNIFKLNPDVTTKNFEYIKIFCKENAIDLVVPSTEVYLCEGIKDYLQREIPEINVFGPNKNQAKIEGSKHFSKNLMTELEIPTANFQYFKSYLGLYYNFYGNIVSNLNDLPVIKYSGLAKGKGVYIPDDTHEFSKHLIKCFSLGDEGVIMERKLDGTEVSVLAFCNGREASLMPQAQDYKHTYDGNQGPNTGGMGIICPANILNETELATIKTQLDRVVKNLNYKGVLYAGLMKTREHVYFLEFNCRFGDPEAQAILNLLETDLYQIMMDCENGRDLSIEWSDKHVAGVVLSHESYPCSSLTDFIKITFADDINYNAVKIYESSVIDIDDVKYTKGGRVLTMISKAASLPAALENIYNNIYKIVFNGAYYRRDIGQNNKKIQSNNKLSIGVLASGNGTSIENVLEQRMGFIKVIITNNKDARVIAKAQKYNVPFVYLPQKQVKIKEYYERVVNILRSFDVELVILSGFMKIVSADLFNEFFTINIHPSLLPKYSGMMDLDVHNKVIENKEQFSGCTLHEVTKVVDGGRVLMQRQCKLDQNETSSSLKYRVQNLEKKCILDYVDVYNSRKSSYSIDVKEGNEFVDDLKKTLPIIGGFCAEFKHKNIVLTGAADGCGTKLDLANKYNMLDKIGIDLVAMNVNDLIAGGSIPLFFMDYIAIDKMDKEKCSTIIKGIREGCEEANCQLIGGETAEMKGIYMKNKLDLAGFAIGEREFELPRKDKMSADCWLYGIPSSGIHSNGYTLVNKLLKMNNSPHPSIQDILKPTVIYTDVARLWREYPDNIFGISHITGGGFHDNITRILPDQFTFKLNDWEFPEVFKWIQSESQLSREEMLSIFNCGYGMVIISDAELELPKIGKLVYKVIPLSG